MLATIDQLLSLFDPGRPGPIFLLGAGASIKSGVPLSGDLVEWAARWKYCRTYHRHVDDPTVKRTDWLSWLQSHKWYDKNRRAEDNYCEVVEYLLVPKTDRKEFFLWSLNRDVPASSGYEYLLKLLDEGFTNTVLTTNFDRVLPDLKTARKRPHFLEVIRTPDEMVAFSTSPINPQLVYLHGAVEYYTDQNLREEIQVLKPKLVNLISPMLRDHPLIVVGYRGAEPSIVRSLLLEQANFANNYPQGIFWCSLDGKIHPLVAELAHAIYPNFEIVVISGFDELLRTVSDHCDRLPKRMLPPSRALTLPVRLPFDMTSLSAAALDELNWNKIREELIVYCQRMNIDIPSDVNTDFVIRQMCNLDLLISRDGSYVPTVAGYLLFGTEPTRRIKGASIEFMEDGRTKRTIRGNLWAQKDALDTLLDEVNRPFILKTRNSEVVYPYPKIALRELCINALVHRSYSGPEKLLVQLERNCIRISNPGGLVEEVAEKVHTTLQQQIEAGATGIKGYRNSVVADLFCGAGRMEKRGSGLPDVHRSVTKNGGKVFFGPTEDNKLFKAIIYRRAEEVDTATGTATPVANISRYSSNLLEFTVFPQKVWDFSPEEIERLPAIERPPVFPAAGGRLLSFAFMKAMFGRTPPTATDEFLATAEGRRQFVGLLNQCVQAFFRHRGLIVDEDRKRAYFPRTKEGPREIRYQASFRQATRTVTKPFVSRVSKRVLYWIHEAVWFGIERYGGQYVLRLLPGYVFTVDGVETLLNHRRVGALATRMAARDFSLQVFNHLVFWAYVLSRGKDVISIPTGAEPLKLKAVFAGCDLDIPADADVQFEPDKYQSRSDRRIDDLEEEISEDAEVASESDDHVAQH